MAAFIAKQVIGSKLKEAKGAVGGDDKKEDDDKEKTEDGEDPEIAEARREAEEKRKEKHRKMEEERETMRQEIRDKYGLKKKEDVMKLQEEQELSGRLGRKKKTPEEMAAEANAGDEEDDDFASKFLPANVSDLTAKVSDLPGNIANAASEKCTLQ